MFVIRFLDENDAMWKHPTLEVIGDIANLNANDKSSIVNAFNSIKQEMDELKQENKELKELLNKTINTERGD